MLQSNEKTAERANAPRPQNTKSACILTLVEKPENIKPARRKTDLRIIYRKRLLSVRMSGACYQVALCICEVYADNETGEAFPALESIAKKCGLSIRAVQDAIATLKRNGFLKTERRGFNRSLLFILTVPEDANSEDGLDENLDLVSGRFSYPYPADSRVENYENLPPNLTEELDCTNKTADEGSALGPALPAARPSGCSDHRSSQGPAVQGDGDPDRGDDLSIKEERNPICTPEFVRAWAARNLTEKNLLPDIIGRAAAGHLRRDDLARYAR